jgi:hypothetical protein
MLPYGRIMYFTDTIVAKLEEKGYVKIRCSVDNLMSTTPQSGKDRQEEMSFRDHQGYPYNAAGGFSVVVEKPGTTAEFTIEEIDAVQQLAIDFGYIIFGRQFEAIY